MRLEVQFLGHNELETPGEASQKRFEMIRVFGNNAPFSKDWGSLWLREFSRMGMRDSIWNAERFRTTSMYQLWLGSQTIDVASYVQLSIRGCLVTTGVGPSA